MKVDLITSYAMYLCLLDRISEGGLITRYPTLYLCPLEVCEGDFDHYAMLHLFPLDRVCEVDQKFKLPGICFPRSL